ncbi:PREDICTED: protein phosphatase 1 regulatory subunit 3D [Nanorana parkeri]|uniref:protein phosphatase 1 regulatory subunit 3D n=1 Tax=Nanorana parkeri TaxID=125878 RepID=UPI000854DEBD|nr:PREDICTED: protein phosphatase 1 regulatory subunit 3D [Nanorana parkeri]
MAFKIHPSIISRSCKQQAELGFPRSLSYINDLYKNVQLAEGFGGHGARLHKDQRRPCKLLRTETALGKSCDPELRPIIRRRTKSLPSSPERKIAAKCRPQCHKVRFADSLGLELAEVKVFNAGDNPSIPLHVLSRLSINSDLCCSQDLEVSLQYLEPDFKQPGDCEDFLDRLRHYCVCLEHVTSSDELGISGTVRVLNLAFEKKVTVRYSFTNWKTHSETLAVWQKNEENGILNSDTFAFTITLPPFVTQICSAIQFAIKYQVADEEYWDNNQGINYTFTSRSHTLKMPKDIERSWIHFI